MILRATEVRTVNGSNKHGNDNGHIPSAKKACIREKVEYNDLQPKNESIQGPALRLTHPDRYLQGPTPLIAAQYHTSEEILSACQATTQEIMGWRPNLPNVLKRFSC